LRKYFLKDYPATTLPVLRYACAVHTIETIFEANGNRLFSSLMRMAGDADPAYDILQESVTRYMERYHSHELSLALLFTVARNAFTDPAIPARERDDFGGENSIPAAGASS
jgi:predicted RNA polymerase sigma factor